MVWYDMAWYGLGYMITGFVRGLCMRGSLYVIYIFITYDVEAAMGWMVNRCFPFFNFFFFLSFSLAL